MNQSYYIGMCWLTLLNMQDDVLKCCLNCDGEGCRNCERGWVKTGQTVPLWECIYDGWD